MTDLYEKVDDKVKVVTTTEAYITIDELKARLTFWNDELARIEADYIAQKAAAEATIAELDAALKTVLKEEVKVK